MAVVLNKEQIMEIIPHRDPFLLIDEVNELEVGKRVKATKYIKAEVLIQTHLFFIKWHASAFLRIIFVKMAVFL